jgi:hypothetical protein
MVTVFDVLPPVETTTGTAVPLGVAAGTRTFTWYKPTNPGASPAQRNWAVAPPIVTVGFVVVAASGLLGDAEPLVG